MGRAESTRPSHDRDVPKDPEFRHFARTLLIASVLSYPLMALALWSLIWADPQQPRLAVFAIIAGGAWWVMCLAFGMRARRRRMAQREDPP